MRISYLAKVLLLLLGLVFLINFSLYIAVRLAMHSTVMVGAHSELQRGGAVFAQLMRARSEQLSLATRVLTDDFGFKNVVAGGDSASIRSALHNHAERIDADIAVVANERGRPLTSTQELADGSWEFLTEYSQEPNFSSASRTKMIGGRPYQFVLAEMRAPLRIGLVGMGFEVDNEFTRELKRLVNLDISFISVSENSTYYLSGTLQGQARAELMNRLQSEPLDAEHVVTTNEDMLLVVPVLQGPTDLMAVLRLPLARVLKPFSQLTERLFWITFGFSVLAALLAFAIARGVTQPVSILARVARRVADGHYDTAIPVQSRDELGELALSLSHMQTAIAKREQHIRFQTSHDWLTGLINRGELFNKLRSAIEQADRSGIGFALLVADINKFTRINDAFGPEMGNQVLMEVARILQSELDEGQTVARLGSDEFALVLERRIESSRIFASALHDCFSKDLNIQGARLGVSLTMGFVHYPEHGNSAEVLLRRASLALGSARSDHKHIMEYQSGWDEEHLKRLQIFSDFKQALDTNQLSLCYQPKLGLNGSDTLDVEALIRWKHPNLGNVNPEELVAVAESSGQIGLLTRWVLRTSVAQVVKWPDRLNLSVNLSALDLMDSELPAYIADLLKEFDLAPQRLWLEITESSVMQEGEMSLDTLMQLKALGVVLSIDDFGTGYSSLSQLKKLPVSELKIDKVFVLNMDNSEDDQLIVHSIVNLAHTLGLSVTAEGIERKSLENLLVGYGCERGQGYYYSKPLPAEDFERWLYARLQASFGKD